MTQRRGGEERSSGRGKGNADEEFLHLGKRSMNPVGKDGEGAKIASLRRELAALKGPTRESQDQSSTFPSPMESKGKKSNRII